MTHRQYSKQHAAPAAPQAPPAPNEIEMTITPTEKSNTERYTKLVPPLSYYYASARNRTVSLVLKLQNDKDPKCVAAANAFLHTRFGHDRKQLASVDTSGLAVNQSALLSAAAAAVSTNEPTGNDMDASPSPSYNGYQVFDHFFNDATQLTAIDMSGLSSLRKLGTSCFFQTSSLQALDLSKLGALVQIGDYFLQGSSVATVNLDGLKNLTEVGNYFLFSCANIVTLNCSRWLNLKKVGKNFASCCESLESVDTSNWLEVRDVGDYFLSRTNYLSSFTGMTNWKKLQKLGNCFLRESALLRQADSSFPLPLENLSFDHLLDIGTCFLTETNFTHRQIDFSRFAPKLEKLGAFFLAGSTELTAIDLSSLSKTRLKYIDKMFLAKCPNLRAVTFEDIGVFYAALSAKNNNSNNNDDDDEEDEADSSDHDTSLHAHPFTPFPSVTAIHSGFLCGCRRLTLVAFGQFPGVTRIDDDFVSHCTKLKRLTMSGFPAVATVGANFLRSCTKLEFLDLSAMNAVTTIGEHFAENCTNLKTVLLSDALRQMLPRQTSPLRGIFEWHLKKQVLLIREKSQGHARDAFQIWNVMRFVAQFL